MPGLQGLIGCKRSADKAECKAHIYDDENEIIDCKNANFIKNILVTTRHLSVIFRI